MQTLLWNGEELRVEGTHVFNANHEIIGKLLWNKMFDINGKYVGTLVDSALVFLEEDSNSITSKVFVIR